MMTRLDFWSQAIQKENSQENLAELEALGKAAQPGVLKSYLNDMLPDILNFAVCVLLAILIYFIGGKLIKWLRKILRRALERSGADEGVRQFLDSCTKVLLYMILIMIVINQLGVETTSVVALLGSAGLAIGLALQGSLSNFAGGVLILLFKPFQVGDYIIEDTHKNEGTVTEIMIFYTKLLTVDNKVVIIPNGILANASLTNVTHQEKRRVDLYVGISYDSDMKTAKQVLKDVLTAEPSRIAEEEIVVFVDELKDSSVQIGGRVWVTAGDYWPARWRMTELAKERLEQAGIEIPYNQLTVSLEKK